MATTTRTYALLRHTAADRVVPPFGQQDGGDAAPAPASFPDKVGDVDCEFLSRVLGAKVKAFKVEPLGLVRHTTHTHTHTHTQHTLSLLSFSHLRRPTRWHDRAVLCWCARICLRVCVCVCVRAHTCVCAYVCDFCHCAPEQGSSVLCFVVCAVCATVVKGFDAPRARICVGT